MNWLFESPFTILLGALAIGFVLGVAWVQTGKNAFLFAVGGVVAAAVLLLVLERSIETDTEKVRKLLHQIAGEIENNDADRVVQHIVGSQPELAKLARQEMSRYEFTGVSITKIYSITEFPQKQPPAIVTEFTVAVSVAGAFLDQQVSVDNRPVFFKLTFWKDRDGQWKIADYEYDINRPFPKGSGGG